MPEVKIIGCGPGNINLLTKEAMEAVHDSDVVYGAKRLIEQFKGADFERIEISKNYQEILNEIKNSFELKKISVLVTGDTGFYSYARLIKNEIGFINCKFYSGISSVQHAFNKIGVPWQDAHFISTHGNDNKVTESELLKFTKSGIITNGAKDAGSFIKSLGDDFFIKYSVFLCEDLSLQQERVTEIKSGFDIDSMFISDLNIILIIKKDHEEIK